MPPPPLPHAAATITFHFAISRHYWLSLIAAMPFRLHDYAAADYAIFRDISPLLLHFALPILRFILFSLPAPPCQKMLPALSLPRLRHTPLFQPRLASYCYAAAILMLLCWLLFLSLLRFSPSRDNAFRRLLLLIPICASA